MNALLLACLVLAQDAELAKDERKRFSDVLIPDNEGVGVPALDPKPIRQAPSTITIIRGEELRRTGVRFLPDALRLVPGVEIQRLSSSESSVSVRAYNDDSSAAQGVLGALDGRLVYHEWFGSVVWDILPVGIDEVERIEVIRGPGSFVHGPNAMHGMVSIITKSPLDYEEDVAIVSGAGGSYQSSLLSGTMVRRVDENTALKAKVGWDDIVDFGDRSIDARDKAYGELRFEHRLTEGSSVDLTGGVSQQKFNVLVPGFFGVPTARFSNDSEGAYARALYSADLDVADFRLQSSWTRMHAEAEPSAIYVPFTLTLDTMDAEAQVSFDPFPGHAVAVGTGYRYSTFETDDVDIGPGRHGAGLYWIFVQDEYAIAENFWITGGVRWDHHTVAGDSLSPRLAAVWEFSPRHVVRASAGYGFRNPSLRELWLQFPLSIPPLLPAMPVVQGNKDLKPEQMRSFELAYLFEGAGEGEDEGGSNLKFGVAAYYNLIDRLVTFVPTSFFPSPPFPPATPSVLAPQNTSKEDSYGGEIEIEYLLLDELSVFANYSYGVRRERDGKRVLRLAPLHKANAGFRVSSPDPRLSAMIWASFFDEVEFDDPTAGVSGGTVDEYILVNTRVNYSLPGQGNTLFVQAFNLLDHDHRQHPDADEIGIIALAGLELTF